MNAETFNALHPVGTLVFAYPGARPPKAARKLVSRTRSRAWVADHGKPVVMVDELVGYISLSHVDVVTEAEWEAAKTADAAAASVAAEKEQAKLRAELDSYEVMNPQQCQAGKHADWLVDSEHAHACPWCHIAELEQLIAALEAERHRTNEWADDAAKALRANRDRIAELEDGSQPDEIEYAVRMPGSNDVWPRKEFRMGHWERVLNEGGTLLQRVIRRSPWVEAPNQCPGFEGNPVAPDLCAGCGESRDSHEEAS